MGIILNNRIFRSFSLALFFAGLFLLFGCKEKEMCSKFSQINQLNQLPEMVENCSEGDLVLLDFDKVLIPKWGSAFSLKAFDSQMSEMVSDIKQTGATVGGITKRIPVKLSRLDRVLRELDVEFNWLEGCRETYLTGQRFHNGVLFVCPWMSKGQGLKQFFSHKNIKKTQKPARITLLDDSVGNLESVQGFCVKNRIEFTGILYKA